jgi:hypothetical protein
MMLTNEIAEIAGQSMNKKHSEESVVDQDPGRNQDIIGVRIVENGSIEKNEM